MSIVDRLIDKLADRIADKMARRASLNAAQAAKWRISMNDLKAQVEFNKDEMDAIVRDVGRGAL